MNAFLGFLACFLASGAWFIVGWAHNGWNRTPYADKVLTLLLAGISVALLAFARCS